MLSLLEPAILRIGINIQADDQPMEKLTRAALAGNGCKFGHEPCIAQAQRFFENWMQQPNTPDYNQ